MKNTNTIMYYTILKFYLGYLTTCYGSIPSSQTK